MIGGQVPERMAQLSERLDDALAELRQQSVNVAEAERTYRRARAEAWATTAGEGLLARQREDTVNATTAETRYDRDLAEGLRQSALESVRSLRAQISALQTYLNAERAEAEFARSAP